MKIQSVEIHDLFGTEDVSFAAGSVVVVSGANGTGKSSILRALLKIFEGGHDPSIRRRTRGKGRPHVEKGWARITLDSGTTITMTVSEKRTIYEIQDEHGQAVPGTPRQFIEQLGGSMAVDPGKLLALDATTAAGKKALLAAILETIPIAFQPQELPELCRPSEAIDLMQFEKHRKAIEETRRRVGIEARDAEGTLRELAKSLPEITEDTDWTAKRDEMESERRSIEREEMARISAAKHDSTMEHEAVKADFSREERELRERFHRDLLELQDREAGKIAELGKIEAAAIEDIKQEFRPRHELLITSLAEAKEKAAQQERVRGAKQTLDQMRSKVREKNVDYERYSRTLEEMDRVKRSKLETLPVDGLGFDGESVLVDDVEWQHVNRARIGVIAYQISALRAGKLPILIIDDAEHLDRECWRGVVDAAVSGGFQVIAARVSEAGGALKIESGGVAI